MKVSEKVLHRLRELIENQQLQVGDRLPAERKLCETLGVSRASLREAMQHLISQGILTAKVGAGSYLQKLPSHWSEQGIVQPISQLIEADPNYRFDVQEARSTLEGGTAWYAAQRATPEDLQKIRDCYARIASSQSQGKINDAARADAAFHLAIAEASHNVVLIQMMRSLFDLLQHNVVLARRKIYSEAKHFDQLQDQHWMVMQAIERGDPEAARQAVCGHIEFIIQQVRNIDEAVARQQRASRLTRMDE